MSLMDLSPLIFKPLYLPKVWGGRQLSQWGKQLPAGAAIGESWELYDRPDKSAVVAEGPWAGRSLAELCAEFGPRLLGPNLWKMQPERFPLLVKLIDASQDLSVQVHPDNDQAALMVGPHEPGKSEMWVVLHAEPGAKMSVGLKPGVDAKVFRNALSNGGVESLLRKFSVEKGDVIDIPAGCVHALGKGCLVAEVQQNSDTTFRVWDYERLENGQPRPLHVDQALRVIDFSTAMAVRPTKVQTRLVGLGWAQEERLVNNASFDVRRLSINSAGRLSLPSPAPQVLLPLDADLRLDGWGPTEMIVPRGACVLVPASLSPQLGPLGQESVTVLWAQPNAF
jgi:mannose-6-phosphate isomerase class I